MSHFDSSSPSHFVLIAEARSQRSVGAADAGVGARERRLCQVIHQEALVAPRTTGERQYNDILYPIYILGGTKGEGTGRNRLNSE